jgi:hypothetical protein
LNEIRSAAATEQASTTIAAKAEIIFGALFIKSDHCVLASTIHGPFQTNRLPARHRNKNEALVRTAKVWLRTASALAIQTASLQRTNFDARGIKLIKHSGNAKLHARVSARSQVWSC